MNTANLEKHLNRFGVSALHSYQQETIEAILGGQNTFSVFPTGSGKSLCFQLPAVLRPDKVTVVVSPLIALMQDQVQGLRKKGISAVTLNYTVQGEDREQVYRAIERKEVSLVYVSPETMASTEFSRHFKADVALLAIDEGHCISTWGHSFRPNYLVLPSLIKKYGFSQVAVFTATATPLVREEVKQRLGLTSCIDIIREPIRENIAISVSAATTEDEKKRILAEVINSRDSSIIYCATRKTTIDLSTFIEREMGCASTFYHGGLSPDERTTSQDRFMKGDAKIICATNAFGMGIDKADIRLILHFDIPGSPESYVQEIGRAGRDGLLSAAVLCYLPSDLQLQMSFLSSQSPSTSRIDTTYRRMKQIQAEHNQKGETSSFPEIVREMYKVLPFEVVNASLGVLVSAQALVFSEGRCSFDDNAYSQLDKKNIAFRTRNDSLRLGFMKKWAESGDSSSQLLLDYMRGEVSLSNGEIQDLLFQTRKGLLELTRDSYQTATQCRDVLSGKSLDGAEIGRESNQIVKGSLPFLRYIKGHDYVTREFEWLEAAGFVSKNNFSTKGIRYKATEAGIAFLNEE